ncbi:RNA polymerase subunit sigma-70 [Paenibacillus elgii]|uniref:RNA polymerase subunit sigma-70 n=1 Tax=Paenibacillus elgii TaxID=189691 RepID=A0A163TBR4_9BACL|nr:sigma-70 family RNA polymerase sigma factor [Paenibacillus elgii]KZE71553.1 RNA polymerase subunit sigma-70 [Paenibacillus elgii]MCM3268971.1 sigma-70 family RNA polymerase sigma factor [Paenibacillus elgii]PUA34835.1 RNA polymerase subunit sigma-70 [Paenibacillus elgii]
MKINSERFANASAEELIVRYQETGCNETATVLLQQYEPMVKMAAGKMSRNRPDLFEDLYQVGQMSVLKLLKQFDLSMGVQFEAYMMKSVIGHMKNYLRDKSWYVQVPRRIKEKGNQIQQVVDMLTVKLERSPNIDEIAAEMELSVEETIEILAGRDYYHYVSLDTPLSTEDNGSTIGDVIGSPSDAYLRVENRLALQEALVHLKPEEQQVLHLAYVEGQSQRTIANQLGVSQMSVSRIQKRALDKLKKYFTEPGADDIGLGS